MSVLSPPASIVSEVFALLNRVLDLVDRETAKAHLDRLAVLRANLEASEAFKARFGQPLTPGLESHTPDEPEQS